MKKWFFILKRKLFGGFKRKTYFEKNGHRLRKTAKAKSLKLEKVWEVCRKPKEEPVEYRAKKLKKLEKGK